MQNLKLTLQYDGTRYLGWTKPEKEGYEHTVSYRIRTILEKMTKTPVTLYAGAKTEAGVHAAAQTASFQTPCSFTPDEFRIKLNRYLPQDISVLNCSPVPERFRADLNAVSRTYEYRICTALIYDIFTSRYSAHIFPFPDITAIQSASALLLGEHDFRGFSSAKRNKNSIKEIFELSVFNDPHHNDTMIIRIRANDFLYHMPSLIIGTLLSAGQCPPSDFSFFCRRNISSVLDGKKKAEILCDPKGLLLSSIEYD